MNNRREGTLAPRGTADRGGIISRLIFLIFLVVVFGLLYLVRYPLMRIAGDELIVDQAPQPSDAIIVLGGDSPLTPRADKAAQLFKAGWAPTVVASGQFLRPYANSADFTLRDLNERGVPTDHILRFSHNANNTLEEIIAFERLAAQKNWKRVIIVTSNYHTRRAHIFSDGLFPQSIQVRVISAPDPLFDPNHWWQEQLSRDAFFHEWGGCVVGEWQMRRAVSRERSKSGNE